MSESPTRAIVVREWFKVLQARIPEAKAPTSVVGLAANEPVTACRVAVTGTATPGLGQTATVAVVIGSAAGVDEVVRVDSSAFEVYLPDNYLADVTDSYVTPARGPNWPIVVTPGTKTNDLAAINSISANTFESATEMLAIGPRNPDSPGSSRSETLVLVDPCGRVAVDVALQNGKIRMLGGAITPPVCNGSDLRSLIAETPEFNVSETSLALSGGNKRIELARSNVPLFRTTKLLRVKGQGVNNQVSASFTLGDGGLRSFSSYDGCNWVSAYMAFSSNRFVLLSRARRTLRGCKKETATAFVPFKANSTGMGTWKLERGLLTLTFMDGMTAVIETRP